MSSTNGDDKMLTQTTFLNRQNAAEYLKTKGIPCCVATLAGYACRGGGPLFQKFGRKPLYTQATLDQWVDSRLSPATANTYNTTSKNASVVSKGR
jgi:hypothetical protein